MPSQPDSTTPSTQPSSEFNDVDVVRTLANYAGWDFEILDGYHRSEPPTFLIYELHGPYTAAFDTLSAVMKFLTEQK